ncbi:folylpolyglutamate synthase, mitochondrial-like [Dermacentor variabilis]|uniref:folylpolyglutamate synthase, mitochondrial-like n=1 Tax=Dermacentor variabilis TaxID=34621 RepID=UPI003F5C4D0F
MRNLLCRLMMVKPTHVRTVCEVPSKPKSTVSTKRCYEDAVYALNNLQSNEATLKKSMQHPPNAFLKSRRMPEHLQAVGLKVSDLDDLKIIHVAGTKGKGSTCAFAECILRQHGFKTGLYTSPHLVAVRERIRINGKPLSEDAFAKYFWDVYQNLKAKEGANIPAYFQFLTVMAFKVFIMEKVDVLVLEVGVGGEYDSTNVIRHPTVVGITSLGLDHTRVLGSSLQEIAWQKSGIFKKGCPAFSLPQPEGAFEVLQERAQERGCSLSLAPPLLTYECELPLHQLGIPGEPQQANASLALQLCKTWLSKHCSSSSAVRKQATRDAAQQKWLQDQNLPFIAAPFPISKLMAKGLEQCRWAGRCQVVPAGEGMTLYLDGAHTEESVHYCVRWWREAAATEQCTLGPRIQIRRVLLFNCMGDRRPEVLLSYLAEEPFHVAIFTPNRITINKSPYSDQSDFTVEKCTEMARCKSNMRIWCHLLSSLQEEEMLGVGSPTCPPSIKGNPEDSCIVFPSISDVMTWLREQQMAARQMTPSCHIQVLVTGSLHLIGGVMRLLDPKLALL